MSHTRDAFDVVRRAIRLPPEERTAFLATACPDGRLRREVDALLAADADVSSASFLNAPVLDVHGLDLGALGASAMELDDVASATPLPRPGDRIGPYVVESTLGAGGMGVVFRAFDPRLRRRVAIKLLPVSATVSLTATARFLHEARAASALDHPGICTIYEIGETSDGRLYLVMACYDGETLSDRIVRGLLPIDDALDVVRQAACALGSAHDAGIVHRDVKPSNLFVTHSGVVKVLDFGIAKLDGVTNLTRSGALLGTVAYMAPEQARGEPVDARADVWALGVVAFELLTGVRPFVSDTPAATLHALQHTDPPPLWSLRPGVPHAVETMVERMLAKNPDDRAPSMAAVAADLDAAVSGVDVPALRRRSVRPSPHTAFWPRTAGTVAGVVALVVLFMSGWLWDGPDAPLSTLWDSISGSPPGPLSLAVLPLSNPSGDPAHLPLAEGMTDALITDLGQIETLRVLSRTSIQRFRDTERSLPEIAERLGVSTIVEGSVHTDGGRVRITVHLVDADADRIVWSQSYDRDVRNVIALQHEVALAIAREIEATLSPQTEANLADARVVDPEAYHFYLWGLYHRNRETPEAWQQAARVLRQSIALDSTFAPAYAVLSRVLVHMPERNDSARNLAEKALALNPTLSDAYVSLGLYHELAAWNWDTAEWAFRRAIALNPNDADAHHELGLLLMRQRRFDAALPAAQQALYLDPMSTRYLNGVAAVHLFSGDARRALPILQQSVGLDAKNAVTYWRIGLAHQVLGRPTDAVVAFERMLDLGGLQPAGYLGHALAVAGRRAEAQALLERFVDRADEATAPTADAHWLAYNAALVHVGLGQHDAALDALERALRERSNVMVYLAVTPAWTPLHDHPRFRALLDTVGLSLAS